MLSGQARQERPAGYRAVLASSEFRSLYAGSALSWVGDFAAKAAITAYVYELTGSVAFSAASFAISFAPWLLGGYLLVVVAERHTYKRVMIACDLARMAVMAVVALVDDLPLLVILALLLVSALFTPPFEAARSATLPAILGEDRYVPGVALHTSTGPPAQVLGYLVGSSLAATDPQRALLVNAATFAVSAALIAIGVRAREPGLRPERRTGLLRETADGFRVVFGNPALRSLVLLVFAGSLFAIVPEGLGAAWAAKATEAAPGPDGVIPDGVIPADLDRAWAQGLIMGAVPVGLILGALFVGRLVPKASRHRLLRPLAVASPLALVPSLLDPPVPVVSALALMSAFAIGGLVPIANGEFIQALPNSHRARAFGVVQGGLQLLQGSAVLITGYLAMRVNLPDAVGLWALGGVVLMLLLSLTWPRPQAFTEARASAAALNASPAHS